jgi:hypothetical protein
MWLPLEGLCRQVGAQPWELIVAEEEAGAFGEASIDKYAGRLEKAGCIDFKYYPLTERITLWDKWRYMIERAASSSEMFVLHNSDDYSGPDRLAQSYELGADWAEAHSALFYKLSTGEIIEHDYVRYMGSGNYSTTLFMAVRTGLLRDLPYGNYHGGEEAAMFRHAQPQLLRRHAALSTGGFYTHADDCISSYRNFINPLPPFYGVVGNLGPVPASVLTRLKKMRDG